MTPFSVQNRRIYIALVTARIVFAFAGAGYIHPDEYFQNGEVIAGKVFGVHAMRTWEWLAGAPVRSIGPPAFTTGLPMLLLRYFTHVDLPSPGQLFYTERASFLLLSFMLDVCVHRLVPNKPSVALILLASSHVIFTFQTRPFSNSLEAILLAAALLRMNNILHKRGSGSDIKSLRRDLSLLAAICVVGIFTRITFLVFVLPILINIAYDMVTRTREQTRSVLLSWIALLTPALVAIITTTSAFVVLDSFYFRGNVLDPVLTPLNFLLYNLSPENLAAHGIHPRWLHVAVNLPMILGPPLFITGVQAGWQVLRGRGNKKDNEPNPVVSMNKLCATIVISSLHFLSVQPHQEPRFLIPLVAPAIVLVVNSGFALRAGRLFWITNLVFNFVLAILFGVLHQGGVVPSLFHVHDLVKHNQNGSVVAYWKTYMPPRHLLAVPDADVQSGRVTIADLAGASTVVAQDTLLSVLNKRHDATVYLVTPPFAMHGLDPALSSCFVSEKRIFPHLDLDHIPESVEMGWQNGLSLGIYAAESGCLRRFSGRS